jgi:quercetin dioxygenase-like cupin family protein
MHLRNKDDAPEHVRGGLRSRMLIEEGDGWGSRMAVTWVDVAPQAEQHAHRHEPEQVYVIIAGIGRMHVDGEERDVRKGDVVFIPPNVEHGIGNISDTTLSYVSASTPTFSIRALYDEGMVAPKTSGGS